MSPPSRRISLVDLYYVEMALDLYLSPINVLYPSMEPLLEKAMKAEACSASL